MTPRIDRLLQASPFVLCSLLGATTALGQITPDNTLGNERSVVTPNVNINGALADLIEGGAIRESNLFHSFQDFNVAEFGRVYFGLPAGIQNILSRVTGTNVSNIFGTLGVLGNANLFLINPNGIVFGPNSRLELGGSFFGSTADSVLFDDGTVFSAKNPNEKPLLTINIPSGLQYGSNPGSITNQSSGASGLQVPNGQTLGLIGGEVTIPGGVIAALDGRIELGSVGNGVVNLTPTDTSFMLDYSAVNNFQDISLSEGAIVNTSGEGGGSIQVQGANVSLRDRSLVLANTQGSGSGGGIVVKASQLSLEGDSTIFANVSGSGQGGDLTVDASESVRVVGAADAPSSLGALVFPEATGNGGDISITTGELIVSDGGFVSIITDGEGDAGNLSVDADSTVQVIGTSADGRFASNLSSSTNPGSKGNAGELNITTGELIVKDGAFVLADTFGEGDGGNVTVDASSSIQLIGTGTLANVEVSSGLSSETQGKGNGGDVSITTGQLIVKDGARVSTVTVGEGDAGNLSVDADSTVQLIGTSASGGFSGLLTQTQGTGKAGDVSITTGELIVKDGAIVSASTLSEGNGGNLTVDADSTVQVIGTSADGRFRSRLLAQTEGTGNGGNVNITTGEFIVSDGAEVSTTSFSEGGAGKLTVDADSTVQVIGTSADGQFLSRLLTQTEGKGNAGDVSITTGELIVSDGAQVNTGTFGEGNGGNLTVDADSTVQVIGTSADGEIPSRLLTQTNSEAIGNAGNLSITTGELIVKDGAQVSASTLSEGNGGNLTVDASSSIQLIGRTPDDQFPTGLFTQAQATGNAGELLSITTGQLFIKDGAAVSARSFEQGSSAGTVDINANSIFLDNGGRITAETAGEKGNIELEARDIRLLNRSLILTNADNTDGGNITIDTDTLVGLGNSDITANAEEGSGGRVEIKAQGIFGLEFRDSPTPDNDITATSNRGPLFNGQVILNVPQLDPTSGLNELPGILVDAEAILANDLCGFENNRIAGGSSFIITGKGGLPPTPEDPVINAHRTVGWRTRPGLGSSSRQRLQQPPLAFGHESRSVKQPQPPQEKKVIIEAQGWVTAKDGTIILTAQPFNGTPVEQILPNLDCHSGVGSRE
ncbi:filamentous hemagglutinin N-terminal domain-containing protein [Moorena producens]|uniref:two-partner secretion domain-containing protein n=1 Tax=Moorena producens TaxID=1155739 RepID=UPI003C71F354